MAETNARNRSAWTAAVAAQIRAERAASGKTQRQIIADSGIPKSTYLRMESGERVPDADQLALFAHAVGLPVSEFFRRAEERLSAASQPVDPIESIVAGMDSPEARAAARRAIAESEARRAAAAQQVNGQ